MKPGQCGQGGAGGTAHGAGASNDTLKRRMLYGGRKGKRAKRRLAERLVHAHGRNGAHGAVVLAWTESELALAY